MPRPVRVIAKTDRAKRLVLTFIDGADKRQRKLEKVTISGVTKVLTANGVKPATARKLAPLLVAKNPATIMGQATRDAARRALSAHKKAKAPAKRSPKRSTRGRRKR